MLPGTRLTPATAKVGMAVDAEYAFMRLWPGTIVDKIGNGQSTRLQIRWRTKGRCQPDWVRLPQDWVQTAVSSAELADLGDQTSYDNTK